MKPETIRKEFNKVFKKHYSPRCKDFCWGCVNCMGWKLYDEFNAFIDDMIETEKFIIKTKK